MMPNDEERDRVLGYLRAQGAKLALPELVGKVRQAMAELGTALAEIPKGRLHERPEPGEWSADEVMAHVIASGRYFGAWIEATIDGGPDVAPPSGSEAEGAPRRSPQEWMEELERDREALFARVLAADPRGRLEARIPHPWFGALTWRETVLFLRLHDLDHAGQLRKTAGALAAC